MRIIVTEELRSLLRDELNAERPPPLGDIVGTALRDGRRIRRTRRFAAIGGGTAAAGVVAFALALGAPFGSVATHQQAAAPQSAAAPQHGRGVQVTPSADPVPARTRATTRVATAGGGTLLAKATPEAMLVLLKKLVPPGRTSGYGKSGDSDLHVQMYLDRGKGPGMIRVSVNGRPQPEPRTGKPEVTVDTLPDNCIQSRIVRAQWPDGLTVQADLSTCLAWDGKQNKPSVLAMTDDEASALVSDSRWGAIMDADLVRAGAKEFPSVAYFG
jgi:hypothetical protein